jgi:oxygen-independent coproporphyrinogen-3 oxidase
MCYDELVFDDFDAARGIDFRRYFADEIGNLAPLQKDGLLEVDETSIRITPKGRLLIRNIAMSFDRYLKDATEDQRFSKAI